ncbi:MAG: Rieske 2Fe-2S domain-containing protein [Gammaproteobacteria bacterium]|jgi:Rieske 2Fe-2S family protein|nr:Rieske 2Fe-2S domain-containing protein [Gammaproteobacteria bacterium]
MPDDEKPIRKLAGGEDFDGLERAEASLPASWYFDREHYEKELERIFYRDWLYVCHASAIAEARCFRRFDIGRQSIVLVRDYDGTLRGFHNSCRHRGSALCTEAEGRLKGKLIVCPYHQWSYGLDGRLVATSSHAEAADFDRADFPLFEIAVREWRGGVFVSLADEPTDFKDGIVRGNDRIENWPMAGLVVGHRWHKTMACNWKIFWENFNECLHCPNLHPELCDLVPIYGRRISYFRDEPNWTLHRDDNDPKYRGGLRDGAETWSLSGRSSGVRFDGLSNEEIARGQSYFVSLPSVFIAAHVDYMRTVRILPLGPEETALEVEWLFPPESLDADNFDLDDITKFAKLVMLQDAEASELNQRGLLALPFEQGVLMPEEHYVKAFQDWVRQRLD